MKRAERRKKEEEWTPYGCRGVKKGIAWERVIGQWVCSCWTDKIDSLRSSLSTTPHSQTNPSESPFQDPLNTSIAQRRFSSTSTTDTIPPYDFSSFTTDNQQRWLPQPPSSQPLATPSNNNSNLPDDFVLYPSPRQLLPDERATAVPSTVPNLTPHPASTSQQSRRHSHHPNNNNHLQDPRVAKVISQSHGFSPVHHQQQQRNGHHYYAATVPSNSPQSHSHSARPPVPLFYQRTGNLSHSNNQMHRRIMSTSSIPQEFNDMFDFDNLDTDTMFSPQELTASSFATVNDPLAGQPPGTVSPKDLMGDSAPPSTSFTDLSTPSFESPGCFSNDTSPLFSTDADLAPGHETWDSLFPVNDGYSTHLHDEPSLLTTSTFSKDGPPASPMIRNGSSPGQSPSAGRGSVSGRQSSVSAANGRKREKPLRPLSYDATDPVAVKRARNTEAARKSRARKVERQDQMEQRIAELEQLLAEERAAKVEAISKYETYVSGGKKS